MIKQPIFAGISAIILLVLAWFVIERVLFLMNAERTQGSVVNVSSYNDRCGGGRRRRSYACTQFNVNVRYDVKGTLLNLSLSGGSARGHDQPVSSSRLKMGQFVPIVYDPKKPSKAYEDTIWGVWGVPIMLFFFQIGSLFVSFTQPTKRKK